MLKGELTQSLERQRRVCVSGGGDGDGGGGGGGWCMKTVICNSFCSMSVCLCINGITSCRVCVFVGRLCVLIHQCARSD